MNMAKDNERIAHDSGTYYSPDTPEAVIKVLEWARRTNTRIRVHYGYTSTREDKPEAVVGQDWGDLYDVAGRVGRSMGPIKIPLLIANSRSHGGGGILDDCIVRIRFANQREGGDLYVHPEYQPPSRDYWVGGTGTEAEYAKNFPPVRRAYVHMNEYA